MPPLQEPGWHALQQHPHRRSFCPRYEHCRSWKRGITICHLSHLFRAQFCWLLGIETHLKTGERKIQGLITNQDPIPGKKCQSLIICLPSTWEEKWVSFHICCKWAKESLPKVRKNCERLVHQSNGTGPAAATVFVKPTINQKKSSLSWGKFVSKKEITKERTAVKIPVRKNRCYHRKAETV